MHIQVQQGNGGIILHFGQKIAPHGCYIQKYYLATLYIDNDTHKIRALTLPTANLPGTKDRKLQKEYQAGGNVMVLSFADAGKRTQTVSSSEYYVLFNMSGDVIYSIELLDYTSRYNWLCTNLPVQVPVPAPAPEKAPEKKTRLRYRKEVGNTET